MNRVIHTGACLTLVIAFAACGEKTESTGKTPEEILRTAVGSTSLPTFPNGHPAIDNLGVMSRGPRRLSVEQIERSIEIIGELPLNSFVDISAQEFTEICWTLLLFASTTSQLAEAHARTLGVIFADAPEKAAMPLNIDPPGQS